jgi:hypothetical protein
VNKAREKRYINTTSDTIESLMHYFSVPNVTLYHEETKEEEVLEIRIVYNGTSCGLNQVLWAPWFALPTGEQMLRTVAPDVPELLVAQPTAAVLWCGPHYTVSRGAGRNFQDNPFGGMGSATNGSQAIPISGSARGTGGKTNGTGGSS